MTSPGAWHAQPFAVSLNAVSKHIPTLERGRLVRRRRAGRKHFLSLDPEPLDEAAVCIVAQRASRIAQLDALDDLLQAEDRKPRVTPKKRGPFQ